MNNAVFIKFSVGWHASRFSASAKIAQASRPILATGCNQPLHKALIALIATSNFLSQPPPFYILELTFAGKMPLAAADAWTTQQAAVCEPAGKQWRDTTIDAFDVPVGTRLRTRAEEP